MIVVAVDTFTEVLRWFVWIALVLGSITFLARYAGIWLRHRRARRTWWRPHPVRSQRERPW